MNATRPQFFKVLLPGFSDRLLIPQEFTKHLANLDHCRKATILSPLGKFWHVDLKCNNSNLYFTTGWKAFTQAHDFVVGLFLVFRYEGNMVFTIKVFDLNGCLKEYNYYPIRCPNQNIVDVPKRKEYDNKDGTSYDTIEVKQEMLSGISQRPSSKKSKQLSEFNKIIKPYNLNYSRMCVPKGFCMYHDLRAKQKITLKDSEGRSWQVEFCPGSRESSFRSGWDEFSKANNLKPGDRCVFHFVSTSEMFVEVVKLRKH